MSALASEKEIHASEVELVPMRRRHVRQVLKIESEVYPRPWSGSLFLQEIARRTDRVYLVAKLHGRVVGYGGLMLGPAEGHITTIAVHPSLHRRGVGTKLLLALLDAAVSRGAAAVSLEVRKSNEGAQRMYEGFGFKPVGIRRGYYVETGEDAIVMWLEGLRAPERAAALNSLRAKISGSGEGA